jgi:N utilization substance protein B
MSVKERRQGREEAFKLLFQADQGVQPWDEVVAAEQAETTLGQPAWQFACELGGGAWRQRQELDPVLDRLATGWTVERMASADRALLRLGAFEILHRDDIPVGVTINEAVELAKRYGTDESPKFINGILGTLAREGGSDPDAASPAEADTP